MTLSTDLISRFVKATKDGKKIKTENTVYGTIETYDGAKYVRIDGSELLTPVSTTVDLSDAKDGERVAVMIKNHTAIATGNTSSPAARIGTVKNLDGKVDSIYAEYVETKELVAEKATIENLEATNANIEKLTARTADIETLNADSAFVKNLNAQYATIKRLEASEADIKDLTAKTAEIETLEADSAFVTNLNSAYANINFANIDIAAAEKLLATSGIITNISAENGHITGDLYGVTIHGDLINVGTLKADRLLIKGEGGIYYQLNAGVDGVTETELASEEYQNALHGSNIIARTITADKIVATDLTAFGATIAQINLAEGAIYSGAKASVDNTTEGFYIDKDGQMAVGDSSSYLKYYTDSAGKKVLDISASNIRLGTSNKTVEETIDDSIDDITVGARNLLENSSFKYDLSSWTEASNAEIVADKYGRPCAHISHTETGVSKRISQDVLAKLEPNTTYTLSGWVLTENVVEGTTEFSCSIYTSGYYDDNGTSTWFGIGNAYFTLNAGEGGWEYVTAQLKTDSKIDSATSLRVYVRARDMTGDLYFSELKLEKGNKATDWTPAPEDLPRQADMNDVQADIGDLDGRMNAATATIEKLEKQINLMVGSTGLVVTEDGVTYVNLSKLENDADETAGGLEDLRKTVDNIDLTPFENCVDDVNEITSWIHMSKEDDATPKMTLGAANSEFSVEITNQQISFKQGGTTPAYINDNRLNIDNAVIDRELRLGKFVWKIRDNGNLGLIYEG